VRLVASESVCALVFPARDGKPVHDTVHALERQTRRPDEVVAIRHVAGFQHAVRRALDAGTAWLWLVDGDAVAEPDALERLLEALGLVDSLPRPVMLSSKVVTPQGVPDPGSLPVPQVFDSDRVVAAFDRRLLPVRIARRGSLLVHREGFEQWGLPRAGSVFFGDDLVWTARLLRPEPGLYVPGSVVAPLPATERSAARWRRASVSDELRLLLSDGLDWREKPWFAGRLAEQVLELRSSG
jgi:hypothetical protein